MLLDYQHGQPKPMGQTNERNGTSGKTVIADQGPARAELPRNSGDSFEPVLIPKRERRFTGFGKCIIAMYARGTSVCSTKPFWQRATAPRSRRLHQLGVSAALLNGRGFRTLTFGSTRE